ncbi:MAG: sel1 repeat family protein [Magnetococcus sp. MYC-9]
MKKFRQIACIIALLLLSSSPGYAELSEIERVRKAAERGDIKAQVKMGWIHHEGRGVPQNAGEAAKWYLMAAERGDAGAQTLIALMLALGEGIPQDDGMAAFWFRKAALQSPPEARFQIETLQRSISR